MVKEDAQLAIVVPLVAEGVFDLRLAAVIGAREIVVAHGDGNIANDLDLVVIE